MNIKYQSITLSLLISLFIYLFFRTQETVITKIFIMLFSLENYLYLKSVILEYISLSDFIIYSLPEGLWIFTVTILSKNIVLKIGKFNIDSLYLPLVFSIGLEFLQLFHLTHGTFDLIDIVVSIFFWSIANYYLYYPSSKYNISIKQIDKKHIYFLLSYAIVYLSYVPSS